jgi:hypothetical protein
MINGNKKGPIFCMNSTHLSTFSLPNKSEIYQTVFQMISDAAYRLGGDLADSVKKELDM